MNRKLFSLGLGACVFGIAVAILGLLVMVAKLRLAVIFLGAHELFGMPFGPEDSTKVAMVALVSLAIMGLGALMFVGGEVLSYSKKQ